MELRQTIRGTAYDVRGDGVTDYVTDDGALSRSQDVTDILADCAAARSEDRFRGFRLAPDFRRVASIPTTVIDLYAARGIDLLHDEEAMRRFLLDPENFAFRCTTEAL